MWEKARSVRKKREKHEEHFKSLGERCAKEKSLG
jgi:hypothetical protein